MLVFWPLEMGIIVYFDFGAMHFANGVTVYILSFKNIWHTCLINCSYEQSAIKFLVDYQNFCTGILVCNFYQQMVLGSDWPLGPEENLTFDPLFSVQQ